MTDNGLGLEEIDQTHGGFFTNLDNTKPFVKVALEGFAGTGKTYTAVQLAIGLHRRIGSKLPIVYFDTEKAGKFLRQIFDDAGVNVLHKESRSMADLKRTMTLIRQGGVSDILIIDSISHLWESFLEAYKSKANRSRLQFEDWGIIKPTWKKEFSDPLVADPCHVIFTGRAGYEYANEKNEETGRREIYKSGVKMKVEGETAYEPDILVLMERFEEILDQDKRVWRQATVLKDRSTLIDGKVFKNPTVEDFMPAIDRCLALPVAPGGAPERDASSLFHTEEDKRAWTRRRDVALEEIEAEMTKAWPGQEKESKKMRVIALEAACGTAAWTKVKAMSPDALEAAVVKLREFIMQATAPTVEPGSAG